MCLSVTSEQNGRCDWKLFEVSGPCCGQIFASRRNKSERYSLQVSERVQWEDFQQRGSVCGAEWILRWSNDTKRCYRGIQRQTKHLAHPWTVHFAIPVTSATSRTLTILSAFRHSTFIMEIFEEWKWIPITSINHSAAPLCQPIYTNSWINCRNNHREITINILLNSSRPERGRKSIRIIWNGL
jgi:hypothetical protein